MNTELPQPRDTKTMTQTAPFPHVLEELVSKLEYRPGWHFSLEDLDRDQGSEGLTFKILTEGYDTYHPERGQTYRVYHYFIVPAASYNKQSWRRWLLDRIIDVETHEACEFFVIDDDRPYAPHHGPGNDPYIIFEHGTDLDRRTSYKGETKPEDQAVLEKARERIAREYYKAMMSDDFDEFPWDDENTPSSETKDEAEAFAAKVILG